MPKIITFTVDTHGVMRRVQTLTLRAKQGDQRESLWYPVFHEILHLKCLGSETPRAWLHVAPQPEFVLSRVDEELEELSIKRTYPLRSRGDLKIDSSPASLAERNSPQSLASPSGEELERARVALAAVNTGSSGTGDTANDAALSLSSQANAVSSRGSSGIAVSSNASSLGEFSQTEEYRIPDFAVFVNFTEPGKDHNAVVSIWEVKCPPLEESLGPAPSRKAMGKAMGKSVFYSARGQIILQAIFTLAEYRHQNSVWGFLVAGGWFRAERFDRNTLPELPTKDEDIDEWLEGLKTWEPSNSGGRSAVVPVAHPIFEPDFTDFSRAFKVAWTKSKKEFVEVADAEVLNTYVEYQVR